MRPFLAFLFFLSISILNTDLSLGASRSDECSLPVRAEGQLWKITAYCCCYKCCNKSPFDPAYGITASGKRAAIGMVALNWLPFGTKIKIGNLPNIYTVADRGAKSLFGTKKNPIKHIDIFMPSHSQARAFGVRYLPVKILA